nr:hypothetical protein [Bacillota bacterium]
MDQLVSPRLNEHQGEASPYLRQALALNPLSGGRRNALRAVRLLEQGAQAAPDDPTYPYWCGVIYRAFGLWQKAAEYLHRALELQPALGPARLELAWAYVHVGEFDAARKVLAGAPDDWRLHRLRAMLLFQEGRAVEAWEAYPAVPPDDIPVARWWREYSLLAEAAGDQAPATVLQRLEQRRHELEMLLGGGERGSQPSAELHHLWALLGRLAAAAGDAGKAEEFRRLVPRSAASYYLVRDAWLRLIDESARRALEQGDVRTAVELLKEAVEEADDAPRRRLLVHALCRLAVEQWDQGDIEGAVATWSEARRFDASAHQVLHNLALGFERLGRWEDANKCRDLYLQATRGPKAPERARDVHKGAWLTAMAENAWRAGQLLEARRLLDSAQDHIAKDVHLLTRSGLIYAAVGDGDRALRAAMAALALQPGFEPALQCILHVTTTGDATDAAALNALAKALHGLPPHDPFVRDWRRRTLTYGRRALEAGRADAAMEAFASLLLADSGDVEAWLWAGAAHLKQGNRSGAEDCFTEAIRLDPGRAATYIDLGARFLAEGDRPRAEQYFEQAVQTDPSAATHVTIGELCARIGVPDLAERHLRSALGCDPVDESILVRAVCGLLETGQDDRVLPFLEEALRIAPEAVPLKILAAIQYLRRGDWLQADAGLREAETAAKKRGAEALLEHVTFFRQSLILLRTIGRIDEQAFYDRTRQLLDEWRIATMDAGDAGEELPRQPLEAILSRLPAPLDAAPLVPAAPAAEPGPAAEAAESDRDLTPFLNLYVPPMGWPSAH